MNKNWLFNVNWPVQCELSKERTICKNCWNKKKRNDTYDIVPVKRKNDNNASVPAYENYGNVIIGPSNSGETYYMLTILDIFGTKRPNQIVTRSPNQYSNYKKKEYWK